MASARGLMTDERRAMGAGTTCCLRPRKYLSNPTFVGVRSSGDYPPRASQALHVRLGGRSAPARRQRCTRHPGLLTTRRIRHGAGERREVGASSPAQGATMGCTAGATITHIFRGRHWRNPQHRGRGHSTTWALSRRGHSRHAHLLGTSAREAALSWLVGGVPTPSHMAGCSGAANDHMVSLRAAAEAIVAQRQR